MLAVGTPIPKSFCHALFIRQSVFAFAPCRSVIDIDGHASSQLAISWQPLEILAHPLEGPPSLQVLWLALLGILMPTTTRVKVTLRCSTLWAAGAHWLRLYVKLCGQTFVNFPLTVVVCKSRWRHHNGAAQPAATAAARAGIRPYIRFLHVQTAVEWCQSCKLHTIKHNASVVLQLTCFRAERPPGHRPSCGRRAAVAALLLSADSWSNSCNNLRPAKHSKSSRRAGQAAAAIVRRQSHNPAQLAAQQSQEQVGEVLRPAGPCRRRCCCGRRAAAAGLVRSVCVSAACPPAPDSQALHCTDSFTAD